MNDQYLRKCKQHQLKCVTFIILTNSGAILPSPVVKLPTDIRQLAIDCLNRNANSLQLGRIEVGGALCSQSWGLKSPQGEREEKRHGLGVKKAWP